MSEFEFTVPVVIMGGGACGAVAALAAHDAGAEVLLIERDERPMGTTGMSMGVVCAAGTKSQAAHGVTDSGEIFLADILAKTRGQTDPEIARAIAFGSGPAMDWLIDTHGLPFQLDTGFRAAYGNSTLRIHGWEGHNGQDLIELLHQRVADAGIPILSEARVTDIFATDDRITGIEITRPGGTVERVGCGALIIASGGFAANREMLARHIPDMADARNNGHEGSEGDGIRLAASLGAATADMGAYQGYAMLTDPQGISVPPGVIIDGGIIVNRLGNRFTDEMADIAGMVHPVHAQPGGHCWVIYDDTIAARQAYVPDLQMLNELNAPRLAATLPDLATRIGVDATALEASLTEARAAFASGQPDPLGRLWQGDAPPTAPYRALKVVGAIYHTQGGLQIDGDARVQRTDGGSFPNLFAGGGAARSVSGPAHWGYLPAMGLCTAFTLGRIAGMNAAQAAR